MRNGAHRFGRAAPRFLYPGLLPTPGALLGDLPSTSPSRPPTNCPPRHRRRRWRLGTREARSEPASRSRITSSEPWRRKRFTSGRKRGRPSSRSRSFCGRRQSALTFAVSLLAASAGTESCLLAIRLERPPAYCARSRAFRQRKRNNTALLMRNAWGGLSDWTSSCVTPPGAAPQAFSGASAGSDAGCSSTRSGSSISRSIE